MPHDILQVAFSQLSLWQSELEGSAAFRNLKAWEAVIVDFGGTVPGTVRQTSRPRRPSKGRTPRLDTQKARVTFISAVFIRSTETHRATRVELQSHLVANGVEVTLGRLSAILSESQEFEADRQKGWTLRDIAMARQDAVQGYNHSGQEENAPSSQGDDGQQSSTAGV